MNRKAYALMLDTLQRIAQEGGPESEMAASTLADVAKMEAPKPPPDPLCYDNGGETADRYTVFPRGHGWGRTRGRNRFYIGMSDNPSHPHGVSQWGEDVPGRHLGKRVAWADLPEHIRQHATRRINE